MWRRIFLHFYFLLPFSFLLLFWQSLKWRTLLTKSDFANQRAMLSKVSRNTFYPQWIFKKHFKKALIFLYSSVTIKKQFFFASPKDIKQGTTTAEHESFSPLCCWQNAPILHPSNAFLSSCRADIRPSVRDTHFLPTFPVILGDPDNKAAPSPTQKSNSAKNSASCTVISPQV